jgi:hypothetical protein
MSIGTKVCGVILSERAPERTRAPKRDPFFGEGSGVVSDESACLFDFQIAKEQRQFRDPISPSETQSEDHSP